MARFRSSSGAILQDFEGVLAAWHQDQVDMIRHEAPSNHPRFGWRQVLLQQRR
jgi:hypothetical protein